MEAGTLARGFLDPSHESQATFRAVMWAMARPGIAQPIAPALDPPPPLTRELAALALTLLDYETPVWLDPALADAPAVVQFLRFHTGAPIVARLAQAAFALSAAPLALPDFSAFAQGEPDYPDRSTTLLIAVERLTREGLVLEGPGIKGRVAAGAAPLPADFAGRLAANRAAFPLGIDLVFTAPGAVMALPRAVRVRQEP